MFDKPTSFHSIGLEKERLFLKAAKLSLVKGQPNIESLFEIPFSADSGVVKPLYKASDIEKSLVVTSIEGSDVLIRPLEVKLKKASDIDEVLAFQAEPLLPYPVESAVLDSIVLGSSSEGTLLNVLAVKKDYVQDHLSEWQALGIEPEVISCVPHDLALFSKFALESASLFIVHMSDRQTTCTLVREGKLIASQSFATGKRDFEKVMGENSLSEIDFAALAMDHPLYGSFENWRKEVVRFLYALAKQSKEQEPSQVVVTGEGASLSNLGQMLASSMEKSLLQPNSLGEISGKELLVYAAPIGAALSGLPKWIQVNFRQVEYAYPHPWKRLMQPLALYYLLCIALAAALYLFGASYLGHQKDALRKEYIDLLTTMNKSYGAFEREYAEKQHRPVDVEGIPDVAALTPEEITQRLHYLHREMKESPDLFPLMPNVPRVSDVLAWFSSHPLVITSAGEQEEPSIQIENFSYTMVKRPEPKKPSERYQVKVEMEFSTATPKIAREFHDALIAPNEIVDPKGEVKWSSNRGKYHTSFFLKDKTAYPLPMGSGG